MLGCIFRCGLGAFPASLVTSFKGGSMWRYTLRGGFLLLLSLSLVAFAQETTVRGNLGGVAVDPTAAVIQDAKVTLTGPTGSITKNTASDGSFFFGVLTPGYYSVKVEKQGFKVAELAKVEVYTGRTASVTMTLQPGALSESIEVTATAITVDTASTAIDANLDDQFYSNVPLQRNVSSIFYASPGVNLGGGTGVANPSISGGSGLENSYVADGVNITDGAFGGLGVYTVNYGSLSTGINLSFVKEVQVKTAAYEPQYGKTTGGLVQIVTKSGTNDFHGAVAGYFGAQQFEAQRLQPDDFGRLNQNGRVLHNGAFDVSGEIGGYVPGAKNHLFFFGSFNPSWTRQYNQLADLHGAISGFPLLGTQGSLNEIAYNYASKLTLKISDKHQIESSVFGDPTRSNTGPFQTLETFSSTTFSTLGNGTRNWVTRYNATVTPTWLFNASFAWGHNYLQETPNSPNTYQISDFTGCAVPPGSHTASGCRNKLVDGTLNGPLGPTAGIFVRQGLGFYENTHGDNYGLNFDTQKIVNKLGSHNFSVGFHYERSAYTGARSRSGPRFTITPAMAAALDFPSAGSTQFAGLTSNWASGSIRVFPTCDGRNNTIPCPMMFVPGFGDEHVAIRQTRGEFGDPTFDTHGRYQAAYVNDSWSINKHFTISAGYRWEQQKMIGTPFVNPILQNTINHSQYTFTDNWSPRFGLSIDPKGDRKTKIFGNFARYNYAIPLDMAIRSLSNETDFPTGTIWNPWVDSTGAPLARVPINPDGTVSIPIQPGQVSPWTDAALTCGVCGVSGGVSSSVNSDGSVESIAHGTKMQYLNEWVAGVEHEFPKGLVVDVRFIDRRIKRIVEDMAGLSPEAFQIGLNQIYTLANPTRNLDLFVNPIQKDYPVGGLPASCVPANGMLGGTAVNFTGTPVGDVCITNAFNAAGTQIAASLGSDGKADGFVNPVRIYRAIEFEINKSLSRGWQIRTNYRWGELSGNYEGAYRNDNGQSDPNISSLFDFVQGDFNLLGDQFAVGWLNTDRRHIINSFASYSFTSGVLRNLTLGTGVRIETGIPINDLRAHPAYQSGGEIPQGGRGSLGRTPTDGQADLHAEYAKKLNEKHSLHFGGDIFNLTNQKTQVRYDEFQDRQFEVANADFLKPKQGNLPNGPGLNPQLGFQRPFSARLFAKWVF
jgi:hypothetical protein